MKTIILILLSALISISAWSQTIITGRKTDATTGDPLPYVAIRGVNIKLGAITDFDGYYSIETTEPVDSLLTSYMGYTSVRKAVVLNQTQVIDFSLSEAASTLQEFVVRPGGINPAVVIMKRAQKRKKDYNPEKIEFYEYEAYNKVQLAVDNVTENFKRRKIYSAMELLFDTISSFSDSSAKKVLPVFVSETISDYYFRKFPRRTKEKIKALKVAHITNELDLTSKEAQQFWPIYNEFGAISGQMSNVSGSKSSMDVYYGPYHTAQALLCLKTLPFHPPLTVITPLPRAQSRVASYA